MSASTSSSTSAAARSMRPRSQPPTASEARLGLPSRALAARTPYAVWGLCLQQRSESSRPAEAPEATTFSTPEHASGCLGRSATWAAARPGYDRTLDVDTGAESARCPPGCAPTRACGCATRAARWRSATRSSASSTTWSRATVRHSVENRRGCSTQTPACLGIGGHWAHAVRPCVATLRVGLCGWPVWTSRLIGPRLAAALGSLTHALGRKEATAGQQPSQLVFGTGSLADYTLFMHGEL